MGRANFIALGLALGVLGIWEISVRLMEVPVFILPRPSEILTTAVIKAPIIWPHALTTMSEILLGIGLALVTAIPLAILMFANPGLEKGLAPFLVASQAVPVFALAPLLVVWLGYGMASKV
ncbi:MAG: ABC transporter permease, partial [Planctomycetes bacterium]|nr:ABC transporter permease [Planctomycetota bacterium]